MKTRKQSPRNASSQVTLLFEEGPLARLKRREREQVVNLLAKLLSEAATRSERDADDEDE